MNKVIKRLEHHVKVIEELSKLISKEEDIELIHTPELGILCFRMKPSEISSNHLDELQQYVFDEIKAEGKRSVSLTKLDNNKVLRLVVLNPNVTTASIFESIMRFRDITKTKMLNP